MGLEGYAHSFQHAAVFAVDQSQQFSAGQIGGQPFLPKNRHQSSEEFSSLQAGFVYITPVVKELH